MNANDYDALLEFVNSTKDSTYHDSISTVASSSEIDYVVRRIEVYAETEIASTTTIHYGLSYHE